MFQRRGFIPKNTALRTFTVFLSILVLSLSLNGCAGMSPKTKTTLMCGVAGGLIGAAVGAAVDSGNRGRGALIGAAIGAVGAMGACFAIASYQNTEVADYDTTSQQAGYQPVSGDVMRITEFTIDPPAVNAGQEVAFNAQYYVMTPNPNQEITVMETRTIKAFDEDTNSYNELGSTTSEVTMKPGTRMGSGVLNINSLTPDGNYLLVFSVEYAGKKVEAEQPLTIGNAPQVASYEPAQGTKAVSTGETSAIPSEAGKYFVVVTETTTMRAGSGSTYDIVAQLKNGEKYPIIETTKNQQDNVSWYKIRLDDGREGWVSGASGRVEQ